MEMHTDPTVANERPARTKSWIAALVLGATLALAGAASVFAASPSADRARARQRARATTEAPRPMTAAEPPPITSARKDPTRTRAPTARPAEPEGRRATGAPPC